MSNRVSYNKDIFNAIDILRSYGFSDQQALLDTLCRVTRTKKVLTISETDTDTVYRTMQEVTSSMPRFPGDADMFFKLYNILSFIDGYAILSYLNASSEGRELAAPEVLVEKFAEYITDKIESVLIPECEKYGPGLLDIIESHPAIKFTLTCKQELKYELLSSVYAVFSNVKVQMVDIYSYGFTSERFDLIVAIPVFGGRMLVNDEDFISREPDLIAVQNLLYHINMDGELVIVLPAKITFGGGSTASLRSYIESNYKIKEISSLPAGLFTPYTAIRTYLFVFSPGTNDDVVLKQYEPDKPIRRTSSCQKLVVANEQLLFSDEFAELSGWNIDMAFFEEEDAIKAFSASPVKKLHLKDVATVFRGKAVNTKAEGGNIGVINISNINDTGIDYSGLDYIVDEERKVSRYILQTGDVLVTARGTTVKIAVFEEQSSICIPSANINVIRPKDVLNGTYLKLFLESPVGTKMLKSLQRGTGVVNINFKDMSELEVPVLPLEAQEALVQEYNTGLNLYKETIAAAEEGWRGVQAEIQSKLY